MTTLGAWAMSALMVFPIAFVLFLLFVLQQEYRGAYEFIGPLVRLGLVAFTLGALITTPFIARRKGRNLTLWLLAVVGANVFGYMALLMIGNPSQPCRFCMEPVKPGALICPHCRQTLAAPS